MVSDERIGLVNVRPNSDRWADEDGSYEDFKDYIEYPSDKGPFDFIFIDGRARRGCLEMSRKLLASGGIVVLHDANRKHYREALVGFPETYAFIDDARPQSGGLWIGSCQSLERFKLHAYSNAWDLLCRVS
jgi:hypothetical protein